MTEIKTPMYDIVEAFEATTSIREAAKFMGVSESTVYVWLRENEDIRTLADEQKERRQSVMLTARIPKSLSDKLEAKALKQGKTKSDLINEILSKELC